MALRAQPSKPPVPQSFADMWKLVDDNYKAPASAYGPLFRDDMLSRELLIAIFWEETFFTNKRQLVSVQKDGRAQDVPEGPAIGFGQVEEPDTLGQVLNYFNNRSLDGKTPQGPPRIPGGLPPEEWTPKKILDDDDKAVQLSILVFCKMWEQHPGINLEQLLRIYAGWDAQPHPDQKEIDAANGNVTDAWHNNRQALINGWKACRDKLFKIPERSNGPLVLGNTDGGLQVVKKLINALNSSRTFCNLCYNAFDANALRPASPSYNPTHRITQAFPNVRVYPLTYAWGKNQPDIVLLQDALIRKKSA
jgi:hypothetical protein